MANIKGSMKFCIRRGISLAMISNTSSIVLEEITLVGVFVSKGDPHRMLIGRPHGSQIMAPDFELIVSV